MKGAEQRGLGGISDPRNHYQAFGVNVEVMVVFTERGIL